MVRETLESFLTLFNLERKRDVERYCRNLVVTSEDFVDAIIGARVGGLAPYRYANHFHEISPDQLEPTQYELNALGKATVGPLKGDALRAIRKTNQGFVDRRLLAAHLFYTRSQKYWHMFYFDQRDFNSRQNHWKHGPHIHYSRESFVQEPLDAVWKRVCAEEPSFPKSVHIRYDYHHNRARRRAA